MVKLRQKKRCRQQTVNPKNTLSYRIAARFLRTGRLFLCLAARISRAFIIDGLRLVTSVMRYSPPCGGALAVPYST